MFETIKKLFKKGAKEEFEEMYEALTKMDDCKKRLEENEPKDVTLRLYSDSESNKMTICVYLRDEYVGNVITDRDKIQALDPEEEQRVIKKIDELFRHYEEKLEQERLPVEIAKEKLEFMRLRNELLRKKLKEMGIEK